MTSRSFLDADGNINADRLSKELSAALEFDTRYKQTDNMKKRAVKTATSYDDFKAMVACAHLKKLSKKEVESLSDVKRGWKKASTSSDAASSSALLELGDERNMNQSSQIPVSKVKGKKAKPLTIMDLQRGLRRAQQPADQLRFLQETGLESVQEMINKGADVDALEDILRIVSLDFSSSTGGDSCQDPLAEHSETNATALSWLRMLSSSSSFALMLMFADKDLLVRVRAFLDPAGDAELRDCYKHNVK